MKLWKMLGYYAITPTIPTPYYSNFRIRASITRRVVQDDVNAGSFRVANPRRCVLTLQAIVEPISIQSFSDVDPGSVVQTRGERHPSLTPQPMRHIGGIETNRNDSCAPLRHAKMSRRLSRPTMYAGITCKESGTTGTTGVKA